MIKNAKKKTLTLSIVAVFIILLTVFCVIVGLNVKQMNLMLDVTGRIHFDNDTYDYIEETIPVVTIGFALQVDENDEMHIVNINDTMQLSDDEIKEYGYKALNKGKDNGWIGSYRYNINQINSGTIITFVDGSANLKITRNFLVLTFLLILMFGIVISLLLKVFFEKIFSTVEEGYNKQKRFITDANHELKTPLTIITTNLEILQMEDGENEWVKDTLNECGRMKKLINQLSRLTRMDEEAGTLNFTEYDLSEILKSAISEFDVLARKKNLTIESNIVSGIVHKGDEEEIRQLISILLDNVIKYCDDDGNVSVFLEKSRKVVLLVENTYSNVNSVQLDKLFDRFYREDKARTYNGGSGIGLSIAKEIVEKHKGEVLAYKKNDDIIGFKVVLK